MISLSPTAVIFFWVFFHGDLFEDPRPPSPSQLQNGFVKCIRKLKGWKSFYWRALLLSHSEYPVRLISLITYRLASYNHIL